ncbi:regulatory protein RecX [Bifidobacterium lemurum]|nr:RecX family transcriptional regulator [Bifidobacterium lemurum]
MSADRHASTSRHSSTGRHGFAEPLTCADSGVRRHSARPSVACAGDEVDGLDLDACREAALRLLDAAPRASGALRTRLLDKGYADGIVDEVIERLTRVQLLDDEAYAQSAVRYCAGRMMGRRGTMMELVRKGVSRSMAEHVCAEAESSGVFEESAWELGRSVARKTRGFEPQTRKRRFWSAGGRKGHNPETLRAVAAELFT